MSILRSDCRGLSWGLALLWVGGAAVCFHVGYLNTDFGPLSLFIVGYVICLTQLSQLKTTRQSFYAGLIAGLFCVAPQLLCFWKIFGPAAIPLWIVLAFWIAAFTGMAHASLDRFGTLWGAALVPFLWTGLEYFRSELYYLKFSWLNVGYAFARWEIFPIHILGMYGIGFLVAIFAALFLMLRRTYWLACVAACVVIAAFLLPGLAGGREPRLHLAGIQMEFPNEREIPAALDSTLAKYTNADILVLSEYTLDGPVPASLKDWCRANQRYLVVGGKDPAPNNNYYDTAFVVGPDGEIVFKQVKSVPIQFFKDGLPAPEQKVWDSPWGKIGFCICYDLSYTRVTDRLIRQGAQLLIVPTMDVSDWGEHQHELHARVAPVRAAEYGVPIFRVASSGISQAVTGGRVAATAPFNGERETVFAALDLPARGSLPADRILAPVAVCVTGTALLGFCFWKRKTKREQPAASSESGDDNPSRELSPIEKTEPAHQK
jgi:apolipoprotein N-acyltransferase